MSIRSRAFAYYYYKLIQAAEVAGLGALRRDLVNAAHGNVLEVGLGNANNARYYNMAGVDSFTGIDTNPYMLKSAKDRIRKIWGDRRRFELRLASAGEIPFDDGTFDTVVATFVHCTTADPAAAVNEIHRVLCPGGTYIFLEHVICPDNRYIATLQKVLTPVQRLLFCGCRLDRNFEELMAESSFESIDGRRARLPRSPMFMRPLYLGTAKRRLKTEDRPNECIMESPTEP